VDVFISYSRSDEEVAILMTTSLQEVGLRVWRDSAILGGDEWRAVIVAALERSRIVLLLYSSNSESSAEVSKEIAAAAALRLQIVPLRIENRLPRGALLYEMARLSWVDAIPPTSARLREVAVALDELARSATSALARKHFDESVRARRMKVHPLRYLLSSPIGIAGALALDTFGLMAVHNHLTGFLSDQLEAGMPLLDSVLLLVQAATVGAPVLAIAGLSKIPAQGGLVLGVLALTNVLLGLLLLRFLIRRTWTRWRIVRARSRRDSIA
jgi:hypothetical protein